MEGARWQDDDQLHLTLRFVGEVKREVANDLAAALASIASPTFTAALEGVSHFERKGCQPPSGHGFCPPPSLIGYEPKLNGRAMWPD
jgi:hypothetical protein